MVFICEMHWNTLVQHKYWGKINICKICNCHRSEKTVMYSVLYQIWSCNHDLGGRGLFWLPIALSWLIRCSKTWRTGSVTLIVIVKSNPRFLVVRDSIEVKITSLVWWVLQRIYTWSIQRKHNGKSCWVHIIGSLIKCHVDCGYFRPTGDTQASLKFPCEKDSALCRIQC